MNDPKTKNLYHINVIGTESPGVKFGRRFTLLKRDRGNSALAEEALGAAIAVAKQQGTRSFELRAALSLAKLY